MDRINFYNTLKNKVADHFEGRATVRCQDVTKNNGIVKNAICVALNDSNCAPTVYMDDFYDAFSEGKPFEEIISEICEIFEKHLVPENVDFSFFNEFQKIRENVCYRLISGTKNEDNLKDVPHRSYCDLAVTYFVSMDFLGIEGTVTIRNDMLDMWDVTEEDLYEIAMDNTPRLYPSSIIPMAEMIRKMMPEEACADIIDDLYPKMLVASNTKSVKGASVILYPGLLREVYEHFEEPFYIIPSSVHEVIFISEAIMSDINEMEAIIRSVNETCVSDEDYLSDRAYYYDGDSENNVKMLEEADCAMVL